MSDVERDFYDKEEIHPDCTVQVLTNTVTGEVSVGWWKNEWIPIEEKNPDLGKVLFLIRDEGRIELGYGYLIKDWAWYDYLSHQWNQWSSKIVAWRPLPEVPEKWRADNEN